MKTLTLLGITSLMLLAAGCSTEEPTLPIDIPPGTFLTSLQLEDKFGQQSASFLQGEPVHFVLSVTNLTEEVVSLRFPDAQVFDFFVLDAQTKTALWQWSHDKVFAAAITEQVWQPDETKVFRIDWDQRMVDGRLLIAGEYRTQGVVTLVDIDAADTDSQFRSALIPLVIQ